MGIYNQQFQGTIIFNESLIAGKKVSIPKISRCTSVFPRDGFSHLPDIRDGSGWRLKLEKQLVGEWPYLGFFASSFQRGIQSYSQMMIRLGGGNSNILLFSPLLLGVSWFPIWRAVAYFFYMGWWFNPPNQVQGFSLPIKRWGKSSGTSTTPPPPKKLYPAFNPGSPRAPTI